MPSTSQTLVFGAQILDRYNAKLEALVPYGKVFGKTAMTDLSKSCGVEIVTTEASLDVIQQLLISEPVQLSYSGNFAPFNAIFEEDTIPGYKGRPTYVARRLIRSWASDKSFPAVPDLDITPLYESLPYPPCMDTEASRRLSFGLLMGSKKFAIKSALHYQTNILERIPSNQEDAFGFSATYCSVSEAIYAWHMKERGVQQVVLMDGFKRIGRGHSDSFFGLKLYSLEEVLKLLDSANAAGGSPPLPATDAAPPASESPVAETTQPTTTPEPSTPRRPLRRSDGDAV